VFKSYLNYHKQGLKKLWLNLLANSNVLIFILLVNLPRRRGANKRIFYDSENMIYKIEQGQNTRYIKNQRSLITFFWDGIFKNAQNIEKDYLLNQINFSAEPIVIDCGANVGNFELWLSLNFSNFRYFGFEPEPEAYKCLLKNVNSKFCYNVALGNVTNESQEFYLSTDNCDSSIIPPEKFDAVTSTKVVRGDQFEPFLKDLNSVNFQAIYESGSYRDKLIHETLIDLLKLECEGYEFEAIQGFERLLPRIRYITADLGFEKMGESTVPEVTNYLLNNGFEIVKLGHPRLVLLFKNTTLC
jgi:FkbM family methyltransferase